MLSSRGVEVSNWIAIPLFIISGGLVVFAIFKSNPTRKLHVIWKVLVSVVVITLWLFVWWVTASPAITVFPEDEIVIQEREWSTSKNVLVTNQSKVPLYSVWVKISAQTVGLQAKDIGIEADTNFTAPLLHAGPIGISFDSREFNFADKYKRQAVYVVFYEIRPNSIRTIRVFGKGRESATVNAKLIQFKRSPELIGEKRNWVTAELQPPEPGKYGERFLIIPVPPKR